MYDIGRNSLVGIWGCCQEVLSGVSGMGSPLASVWVYQDWFISLFWDRLGGSSLTAWGLVAMVRFCIMWSVWLIVAFRVVCGERLS